ncbi:putative transcriptional regulator, ArsR family [Methanocella conradii HZ254]|uniref:Transcriptional regulator, ArsR family n=2 Tax=Methanocella TaxID=570266 RepID=H8I8I9_METCZ|nr:putative transcriptional regulator, ArsR family [Methanocella conradii HZ254]
MYAPEWMLEKAKVVAGEIVNAEDRGAIIQAYREKMDLTQEQLSRIMRLRRETISRIEHGKVTPTLAFIHTFSGIATLMEAVKSYRSMNRAVEYLYFIRIGAELGVPQENVVSIVDTALMNYEKKRRKAIRFLER